MQHGKPKDIAISLTRDRRGITLVICDRGKGMSVTTGHEGLGINIMKYRANAIGGIVSPSILNLTMARPLLAMFLPAEMRTIRWHTGKFTIQPWQHARYHVGKSASLLCVFSSAANEKSKSKSGARSKRRGILLVDDHPLFRKGMIQLLYQEPDIEVRAEADCSGAALDAIRRQKFDLAIIDAGPWGGDQLESNSRK